MTRDEQNKFIADNWNVLQPIQIARALGISSQTVWRLSKIMKLAKTNFRHVKPLGPEKMPKQIAKWPDGIRFEDVRLKDAVDW